MNFKLEHSHAHPCFYSTTTAPNEAQLDSKITYQFEGTDLKNVLQHLECFLRGCGFGFRGELGILEQDEKE